MHPGSTVRACFSARLPTPARCSVHAGTGRDVGCLAPDASWAGVGRIRTTRAHRRVRRRPGTRQHDASRPSGRARRTSLGRGDRSHRGLAPWCRHPAADCLIRATAGDRLPRSRDQAEAGGRRERHAWAAPERRDDRRRRAGHDSPSHGVRPRPSALEVRRARGDRRVPATRGRSGPVGSRGPQVQGLPRSSPATGARPARQPESRVPGESALRLHWYDAGLPRPEVQFWVYDDGGRGLYRLDLALPELRYAAEYDGEEFHTADDDRAHDEQRRDWLDVHRHWTVDVFKRHDVYGPTAAAPARRTQGVAEARRVLAVWNARRTA